LMAGESPFFVMQGEIGHKGVGSET
jgi:hypothetical protein